MLRAVFHPRAWSSREIRRVVRSEHVKPCQQTRERNCQDIKPEPKESNGVPKEIDGPSGLEPTRYGDWERKGRATDF